MSDDERDAVVAWLREMAEDRRYWGATLGLRLRVAWLAFRRPHGLASSALDLAADAIARNTHREREDG